MGMPPSTLRFTLAEAGQSIVIRGNRQGLAELIDTVRALLDYDNRENVVDPSWEIRMPGADSQPRAVRIQLVDDD